MDDPEAEGGKLHLRPKAEQEDGEVAASDAGDQYHLADAQGKCGCLEVTCGSFWTVEESPPLRLFERQGKDRGRCQKAARRGRGKAPYLTESILSDRRSKCATASPDGLLHQELLYADL
jgi:hypothetical protein